MSGEPSAEANPMDAFQSVWYRLGLLFCAMYLTVFWFVLGPSNPSYAVMVVWGTLSLVPAVPAPAMRRVPRQWFRVPTCERVLHRIVGVGIFGWLLDVSGWNRHVPLRIREFSGKRAGLPSLEQSVRRRARAHGICFAIHVLLAVLALFSRHPWSATMHAVAGCSRSSLPGVATALHHASAPASAG